jgi:peptide/nickel transport system permease protein
MIGQDPMVSLNPLFRVGWQVQEVVRRHRNGVSKSEAVDITIDLLRQVELDDASDVFRRYPHELSGGMAQRVSVARALAGDPELLIADEPTTALDVTIQAEILALLRRLQSERDMAVLLVTHDWGVVAELAHRAVVMYAGQVVEVGDVQRLFKYPTHPYTAGLMASNPHYALKEEALRTIPGSVPQPGDWPTGCRFAPRCEFCISKCQGGPIALVAPGSGSRRVRCVRHAELAERLAR